MPDQVTIPASPELTLTSVKQQMTCRILECDRGGFIVVFDCGLAAKSSWGEVLDAIEEAGYQHMGIDRPERLPNILEPAPRDQEVSNRVMDTVHSFVGLMAMIGASALAIFSVPHQLT